MDANLPQILLQPFLHEGEEKIALRFSKNHQLENCVKRIKGIKWSQHRRCWYLPLDRPSYDSIIATLQPLASINANSLAEYLRNHAAVKRNGAAQMPAGATAHVLHKVSAENRKALDQLVQCLKLKAYSPSTIKTYRNEFLQLLYLLKNKPVQELSANHIKRYMVYAMEKQGIHENTAHSRLNALKFYFEQVLGKEKLFWEIPRPKKRFELPKMFNQDEVASIINHTTNKKHKTMLMLAYSAGLRVSEVVSLRTADIDSRRMTIHIRQAKGKKDRMVGLSPVLLVMLREYARDYRPGRNGFLFEGAQPGSAYSTRSLQEVLQTAKKKAGIMKPGSIHSLRHSFATHLVDRGTDISMIQKLLGHSSIRTTLRYLHTSNKDLLKIISPLDDLSLKP